MNKAKTPADAAPGNGNELILYQNRRLARIKKIKKRRKTVFLSIAAAVIAVLLYLNWNAVVPSEITDAIQNFFGAMGSGKFPVSIASGNFKGAGFMGNNFGVLTDTSFYIYSRSGKKITVRQHGMSNPQMSESGGKALIFDRGGRQFKVESRFDEPFSGNMSDSIINASMGKSGNFVMITESSLYSSELTVYSNSYKPVFEWYPAGGRILAAALSPDGGSVAAVTVSSKNGDMVSKVTIFRLGEKSPVSTVEYDGTLLFSIQYRSNDQIAAVGDQKAVFVSGAGKKNGEYDYNSKQLECYSNSEGATVLIFESYSKDGGASQLVSLSGVGKTIGQKSLSGEAESVYANDGVIVALFPDSLWHGSLSCASSGVIEASGDKEKALPYKDGTYVFTLQQISRYSFSQEKK